MVDADWVLLLLFVVWGKKGGDRTKGATLNSGPQRTSKHSGVRRIGSRAIFDHIREQMLSRRTLGTRRY